MKTPETEGTRTARGGTSLPPAEETADTRSPGQGAPGERSAASAEDEGWLLTLPLRESGGQWGRRAHSSHALPSETASAGRAREHAAGTRCSSNCCRYSFTGINTHLPPRGPGVPGGRAVGASEPPQLLRDGVGDAGCCSEPIASY